MRKSMKDRIREAKSVQEIERLVAQLESDDYRYMRPDTERRVRREAKKRRDELC